MNFYNQLELLCKKEGIKPSVLVESLGMSKGTMSNWKKGGTPNAEAVVRFSEYFGVSTDFLLLGKEPSPKYSTEDSECLDLFHKLSLKKRYELIGYMKRMVEEETVAAEEPIRKAK